MNLSARLPVLALMSLALVGCDVKPTREQTIENRDSARFSLSVDQGGNAWRLDTRTGEMLRCWQGTAGSFPPQCYQAIVPK